MVIVLISSDKKVIAPVYQMTEQCKTCELTPDSRLAVVENDISWLKDGVKKIDKRTWVILSSTVMGVLLTLLGFIF